MACLIVAIVSIVLLLTDWNELQRFAYHVLYRQHKQYTYDTHIVLFCGGWKETRTTFGSGWFNANDPRVQWIGNLYHFSLKLTYWKSYQMICHHTSLLHFPFRFIFSVLFQRKNIINSFNIRWKINHRQFTALYIDNNFIVQQSKGSKKRECLSNYTYKLIHVCVVLWIICTHRNTHTFTNSGNFKQMLFAPIWFVWVAASNVPNHLVSYP